MKKKYIIPVTEVIENVAGNIMAASGVSSENGIGYGGVDENGSVDAASRDDVVDAMNGGFDIIFF